VGVTGLLGSGRSEMVRCIYGADKAQSGTEIMHDKKLKINAPIDSIKSGMGFLPDDRKADGCIGALSVLENIILALQARSGMFKKIPRAKQIEFADQFIDILKIKTASRETPLSQLSGGNQQKVLLSMWLAADPDVVLIDEPTRGVDVGAKAEIHLLLRDVVSRGKAVVMVSSELPEILASCDRVLIMYEGRCMGILNNKELTEQKIMAMASGYTGQSPDCNS